MVMTPRPAATLILLRDGMEVLMLQRTQNAAFLGGAYVFPGGSLDPQDNDLSRVVGITEAQAKTMLPNHYTGFVVASHDSYRMIEEAGVLVGRIKKK